MSIVLYAIAEPGEELRESGLHGCRLREVAADGLVAIVSDHDGMPLERSGENLFRYAQTIERLMAERTLLPARFGSTLADESGLSQFLEQSRDELTAALDRVRGAVEIAVRAGWREHQAAPADDGIAYMQARVAQHQRARQVGELLAPLEALARSTRRRVFPRQSLPVHDAYLVDRGLVDAFAQLAQDLDHRHAELELVCTGPWPPYSFSQAVQDRRVEVPV